MQESSVCAVAALYRVEVSGWDANEAFFVEKSELEWSENSQKHVVLRHIIPDTGIIFVRLLQPGGAEVSHSVAYCAEFVEVTGDRRQKIRLNSVMNRTGEGEVSGNGGAEESARKAEMEHAGPN